MRRFIFTLSTLFATMIAVVTAAPAAFAERIGPTGEGSATVSSTSSGLPTWEIVLISVAATVAVFVLTASVSRLRHRHGLRPATS